MDITNYEEATKEIIKYMDFMPEDEEARMNLLIAFVNRATGI